MAKKNYTSPSSDIKCTAAAYIAELLITRQEASKKVRVPAFFWRLDKYKKKFAQQMFWVSSFLKVHDENATIQALNSKEGQWIFSTSTKKLDELVEKFEEKAKQMSENLDDVTFVEPKEDTRPMKKFGKQSTLERLRDIDGRHN